MCGIAGYLARERDPREAETLVRRMTAALSHRGPDAAGFYQDGPVSMGHARLSIIDLRAEANQPMVSADGQTAIVFNGEIYNFQELAEGLKQAGVTLRTRSDTEVLLELYRQRGLAFLEELRGMFAFAIWDRPRNRFLLVRDRLGKKPLFFHANARGIGFASELRALLSDADIARKVDRKALHAYLALGYVPSEHAIIAGVGKVHPGSFILWENGQIVRQERYWRLRFAPRQRSTEDLVEECKHHLFESVRLRMIADVPLGAFLSGGIDSSAVVAVMSRIGAKPVKTFSIGFDEKDYSEVEYARQVAKLYETEHHEEILRPNAAELLPKLVEHYGEPFADPSALPSYLLARMTRQHVTVALSGDGGDEAFGGYMRYAHEKMTRAFQRIPRAVLLPVARFLERYLPGRKAGPVGEAAAAVRTHARRVQMDEIPRYCAQFGYFTRDHLEKLCTPELQTAGAREAERIFESILATSTATEPLDRLLDIDSNTYLVDDIFAKVDIASMANSLEVRCPLVDHKLFEFAATVPPDLKMQGYRGKQILRFALRELLPHRILYRSKRGFGIPQARWLRGDLNAMLRDTLLSKKAYERGHLQRPFVETLIDEHESGRVNHGLRLWNLLWLELWHQRFIDGAPAGSTA